MWTLDVVARSCKQLKFALYAYIARYTMLMFTFVHNESGNVNRVALSSKTINPIELRRQHSQSREAIITASY